MSGDVRAISRAKLPVLRTLGESWRSIAAIGGVIALQILIFALTLEIVSTALIFASCFAAGFTRVITDDPSAGAAIIRMTEPITRLVNGIISILLSVNLALATSRWILFKERPPVESIFHWGRRQWRCLGVGLLCLLIILIPMAITVLAIRFLGGLYPGVPANVMAGICALLLASIFLWAMAWMSLTTPLIASDEQAGAIHSAWRRSRGNQPRLTAMVLLILLPILAAAGALIFLLRLADETIISVGEPWMAFLEEFLRQIVQATLQVWIAGAMAVAFAVLTATDERPADGIPQPA
jgi:hypothetical protein